MEMTIDRVFVRLWDAKLQLSKGEATVRFCGVWSSVINPRDNEMKVMSISVVCRYLCLLLTVTCTTCAVGNETPNVLLISIDDLNDWVGCLGGNTQASTPNIDRLAERGVLFSNAHCQAPICNPSRTSLMLGLRPSTTGIYVNRPWFRLTKRNVNRTTLSQYFGEHGYETITAGKIYHSSRVDKASFQLVGPRPGQRLPIDDCLVPDIESSSKLWDFGPQVYEEQKFGDAVTASWAVKQIEKKHSKPFFLATGFYRPHVPFYAPQRFFDSHPLGKVHTPDVKQDDCDDLPPAALALTDHTVPPSHAWFVEKNNGSQQFRLILHRSVLPTLKWEDCWMLWTAVRMPIIRLWCFFRTTVFIWGKKTLGETVLVGAFHSCAADYLGPTWLARKGLQTASGVAQYLSHAAATLRFTYP